MLQLKLCCSYLEIKEESHGNFAAAASFKTGKKCIQMKIDDKRGGRIVGQIRSTYFGAESFETGRAAHR